MASDYASVKAALFALDRQRKAIEDELEALIGQLGAVGMKEPLVDGTCLFRKPVLETSLVYLAVSHGCVHPCS